jgi:hypothetical protein
MFQFPGFALNPYVFRAQYLLLTIRSPTPSGRPAGVRIRIVEGGFPHSEILGSKLVRSSPRLIAAYHVLHRLSAPRHPPNALKALDHSHDRCPPVRIRGSGRPTLIRKTIAARTFRLGRLLAEHIRSRARSRPRWSSGLGSPTLGYVPSSRFQTPARGLRHGRTAFDSGLP